MAFANPTLQCTDTLGQHNTGLRCAKPIDVNGNIYFTCALWRFFYPNCSRLNLLCNPVAGAFVAAVTVCNQRLY